MGLLDGFFSLGANVNKVDDNDISVSEGEVGDKVPELKVNISDKELIEMSKNWLKAWEGYKGQIWISSCGGQGNWGAGVLVENYQGKRRFPSFRVVPQL